MEDSPKHDQWKGTTGGTTWMQKTLVNTLGWMNLPFVYSGMALVIPFYMIFNHKGYISQYHFFRKRMKYGALRSFFSIYLNHFTFGQIILDRFAIYGGSRFKVDIDGNPGYLKMVDGSDGFIQLSSHVGNFEMAGYLLSQSKKPINALIFGGETGTVMENRKKQFAKMNIKLITVGTDMSHVYAMNSALEQGEIISMPGDRIFGSQKSITCDFMGAKAKFPMGPYILAATRETPLLSIFVMKDSVYKYHIYVRKVEPPKDAGLKGARQKAACLAQEFARHLEEIVRKYPYQWLNYYEFWENENQVE